MRHSHTAHVALTTIALGMASACSAAPMSPPAAQTVTVTAPSSAVPSSTANPSSTEPLAATATTAATSSDDPSATVGPAIRAEDRGRALTLDRFIQQSGEWETNQFDIADQNGIQGIATSTTHCSNDYGPTVETRLGNHFDSLSMKVGMSNGGSVSSDQRAIIQVVGNGVVSRVARIPFNTIQPLTVDVKNVNALKIRVYLDPEIKNCGSSSAQIVISDVVVS